MWSLYFSTLSTGGQAALVTGSESNTFSGAVNAGQLAVGNAVYNSPPQSLAVAASGGGSAYAYRTLDTGLHSLQFSIYVGNDFVLPSGEYMVLAQIAPAATSTAGTVNLVLSERGLFLDYRDGQGNQQYVWSGATLSPGTWHIVRIDVSTGEGTGALVLTEDGVQRGTGSSLSLGGFAHAVLRRRNGVLAS